MISDFLKELARKGWKQREIANKAGIPQATISKAANGASCSAETLIRLADAFEVTVDEVLGREKPRTLSKTQELLLKTIEDDEEITRAALKCAEDEKLLKEIRGKGRGGKSSMKYIFITLFILLPKTVLALGETEAMRCKNGIVSPGDSKKEIVDKCGEPAAKRYAGRSYTYAGKRYHGTEEWVYDFGPQEFIYIALIDGDKVKLLYSTREHGVKR